MGTVKDSTHNKSKFYQNIKRKMILIVMLVSFTPLFLITGIMLEQFSRSYKEKVHAHLEELVEKHRQHIDGFLNEQLNVLRFFADSYTIEQLREETFLEAKLARLQSHYGGVFEDIGVVDDSGVQIAYAGPFKLKKAHYTDADWYMHALEREFFISDVFMGLRGLPHFIITVRQDYMGRQWLLRATIDFVAFNHLVENLRMGQTGFAYILNKDEAFQTKPPAGSLPGNKQFARFMENMENRNDSVYIFEESDSTGRNHIHAGAFLKNGEWLLIYQQDVTDAYRDLNRARNLAFLIIFMGGIGIVSTSIVISGKMVNRITIADQEKNMMIRQVIATGKLAAIGELAAGIAHEINNPVAIMMVKAGWIQDLLEEEEFKEGENLSEFENSLEEIKNQARRCREITHKLLSFARKTDFRPQHLQINSVLADVIGLSEQRMKYGRVVLQKNLGAQMPTIQASSIEIQQVFLNLVNNALDAMKKDGGQLHVSSSVDGGYVVVAVTDTGPGIPAEYLEKIFDPFFTTKHVGKGTGLGLSICYGIINKLGGVIDVESEIDKGTTFRVRIPAEAESTVESAAMATRYPKENKGEYI